MTVEQAHDHMLNSQHARRPWTLDTEGKIVLSNGMRLTEPRKSTHKTYSQRKFEKGRKQGRK